MVLRPPVRAFAFRDRLVPQFNNQRLCLCICVRVLCLVRVIMWLWLIDVRVVEFVIPLLSAIRSICVLILSV